MKKYYLIIVMVVCGSLLQAQTPSGKRPGRPIIDIEPPASITSTNPEFDQALSNVNKASVTSGIIYNRVLPLADLHAYNMPADHPHNTANLRFFKQALFELHKASNYKKLVSTEQLEKRITSYDKEMNVVPIGVINTPFQSLNYNPENPNESGLILKDGLFAQVSIKEPFLNGYALVVSPLKNVMQGEKIIYKFSENLIFNNGDTKIKSLIADFGDGKKQKIIENEIIITKEIIIENFKNNGDKILHFTVELSNNFIFNTNATIYTVYGNTTNNRLISQPIACSSNIDGLIENFKIDYVQATDAYQGLNESVALKGQIEPRVFYHTNNGNTQKTLLKPIIIVDGFDPGDGRRIDDCDCVRDPVCQEAVAKKDKAGVYNPDNHTSFVESMEYLDQANNKINLITELRGIGYDVILVNQPTYTTVDGVTVDGGADFIERNAKAFIELVIEVNTKLQTNGSSEKLVVIGPSMGGQITRYALAYMEKKFAETDSSKWQHNTRIWVAFDSPNHGANVPLGDQALIKMLADAGDSEEAKKSFNKLQSNAAKEMLINYLQSNPAIDNQVSNYHYFNIDLDNNYTNASTISQGMSNNAGNPYFQEHYNNQFNNGLPNSHGFPMNLRKLAIVNGSLSGKTFGNGYEKILDVRLFKTIRLIDWNIFGWHVSSIFHSKLFQAETYSMPTSNSIIARTEKLRATDGNDVHILNSFANSIRGNLDNVPGGSIDATGLLHSSITGEPLPGPRSFWEYTIASLSSFYLNHIGFTPEWETHVIKPDQCFIPTFSSIGMKNPNQSWANPLNRNLVCTNETYFDSYFGEANNTPHVKLNYKSVNWLLKELGSDAIPPIPQAPSFPLQKDNLLLTGADIVCTPIPVYRFTEPCKVPGPATWTVSPNLKIISSTDYTVTVSALYPSATGPGTITATFQNGQTYTKNVWVGAPSSPTKIEGPITVNNGVRVRYDARGSIGATAYEWHFPGPEILVNSFYELPNPYTALNWAKLRSSDNSLSYIEAYTGRASGLVLATALNHCGSSGTPMMLYVTNTSYGNGFRKAAVLDENSLSTIYPNPNNGVFKISLSDFSQGTIEISDFLGTTIFKSTFEDQPEMDVNIQGSPKGIYVVKIISGDQMFVERVLLD
jgi:Secretion system C-terminal sorting domain